MQLINKSQYQFTDISTELFRQYDFIDYSVRIENPTDLAVSDSGHRVFDAQGVSHYIPYGWKHLYWKVKEGQPNFVK